MTREELRDYVDEQRTLDNIPYHVYSTLIDGIDTLEQESVLDKIRAEIKKSSHGKWYVGRLDGKTEEVLLLDEVLQIIDKYKGESEEE